MAKAKHKCRCLCKKNTVILWLEIELSATSPAGAERVAEVRREHCSEQHQTCSSGFSPSREGTRSAPSEGPQPAQDTIHLFTVRCITASALAPMQLKALRVTFTAPCQGCATRSSAKQWTQATGSPSIPQKYLISSFRSLPLPKCSVLAGVNL